MGPDCPILQGEEVLLQPGGDTTAGVLPQTFAGHPGWVKGRGGGGGGGGRQVNEKIDK